MIESPSGMEQACLERGFLPFFRNEIPGFSIEELTPKDLWFSDTQDGPWEWKGPVIGFGSCAYGKFYCQKACFVSLDWLPHLINWRRSRMKRLTEDQEAVMRLFDTNDTLRTDQLRKLMGWVEKPAPRLSPLERAQAKAGGKETPKARYKERMEQVLSHLQMQTLLVTADFEYRYDRHGHRYGWGVARYTTPELMYGDEIAQAGCTPGESYDKLLRHLRSVLPEAPDAALERIVG